MSNHKVFLYSQLTDTGRVISKKKVKDIAQSLPDYVTDDHMFAMVALTDGHYDHPYYGRVHYSVERLQNMIVNYANNVTVEKPYLKAGHANMMSGAQPAYGWFLGSDEAFEIVVLNDHFGEKRHALVVHGYYTPLGLRSKQNDEYRYVSSEISVGYKERQLTARQLEEEEKQKDSKEESSDVADNAVNDVFVGLALTNTPFFHSTTVNAEDTLLNSNSNSDDVVKYSVFNNESYAHCAGGICKRLDEQSILVDKFIDTPSEVVLDFSEFYSGKDNNMLTQVSVHDSKYNNVVTLTKGKIMNFFTMSLVELEKYSVDNLSEAELEMYNAALLVSRRQAKAEEDLQNLRAQMLKDNQDYTFARKQMEDRVREMELSLAQKESDNFSLRQEQFKTLIEKSGVPVVVADKFVQAVRDVDVASRKTMVQFTNKAEGRDEKIDVIGLYEQVLGWFSKDMFRGAQAVLDEAVKVEEPVDASKAVIVTDAEIDKYIKG